MNGNADVVFNNCSAASARAWHCTFTYNDGSVVCTVHCVAPSTVGMCRSMARHAAAISAHAAYGFILQENIEVSRRSRADIPRGPEGPIGIQ
jgi:hypothetical protein